MGWYSALISILRIMMTYIDPYMMVTMTVTEMYASMTVVHHSHQNMMMTLMAGVIKKNIAVITI